MCPAPPASHQLPELDQFAEWARGVTKGKFNPEARIAYVTSYIEHLSGQRRPSEEKVDIVELLPQPVDPLLQQRVLKRPSRRIRSFLRSCEKPLTDLQRENGLSDFYRLLARTGATDFNISRFSAREFLTLAVEHAGHTLALAAPRFLLKFNHEMGAPCVLPGGNFARSGSASEKFLRAQRAASEYYAYLWHIRGQAAWDKILGEVKPATPAQLSICASRCKREILKIDPIRDIETFFQERVRKSTFKAALVLRGELYQVFFPWLKVSKTVDVDLKKLQLSVPGITDQPRIGEDWRDHWTEVRERDKQPLGKTLSTLFHVYGYFEYVFQTKKYWIDRLNLIVANKSEGEVLNELLTQDTDSKLEDYFKYLEKTVSAEYAKSAEHNLREYFASWAAKHGYPCYHTKCSPDARSKPLPLETDELWAAQDQKDWEIWLAANHILDGHKAPHNSNLREHQDSLQGYLASIRLALEEKSTAASTAPTKPHDLLYLNPLEVALDHLEQFKLGSDSLPDPQGKEATLRRSMRLFYRFANDTKRSLFDFDAAEEVFDACRMKGYPSNCSLEEYLYGSRQKCYGPMRLSKFASYRRDRDAIVAFFRIGWEFRHQLRSDLGTEVSPGMARLILANLLRDHSERMLAIGTLSIAADQNAVQAQAFRNRLLKRFLPWAHSKGLCREADYPKAKDLKLVWPRNVPFNSIFFEFLWNCSRPTEQPQFRNLTPLQISQGVAAMNIVVSEAFSAKHTLPSGYRTVLTRSDSLVLECLLDPDALAVGMEAFESSHPTKARNAMRRFMENSFLPWLDHIRETKG